MKLKQIFYKFGETPPKGTDIYIFSTTYEQLIIPHQIFWDAVFGKGWAMFKERNPIKLSNETIWCSRKVFDDALKSKLYSIMNKKVPSESFLDDEIFCRKVWCKYKSIDQKELNDYYNEIMIDLGVF